MIWCSNSGCEADIQSAHFSIESKQAIKIDFSEIYLSSVHRFDAEQRQIIVGHNTLPSGQSVHSENWARISRVRATHIRIHGIGESCRMQWRCDFSYFTQWLLLGKNIVWYFMFLISNPNKICMECYCQVCMCRMCLASVRRNCLNTCWLIIKQ